MAQQSGESDVSLTIPSTSLSLFDNNSNYVVDLVQPVPAVKLCLSTLKMNSYRISMFVKL